MNYVSILDAVDKSLPDHNERELLENTVELNRDELVRAVERLSDVQARQKLAPSLTTPMSLIKHCADRPQSRR